MSAGSAFALGRVSAMRYVQPLREGGSLPAIIDTDNGMFVVKFRGAGQGVKALVAELLAGALARRLNLPIPELALVDLSAAFGRNESDPEIQEILRKSHGINVGMRYLDGAFNYEDHAASDFISSDLSTRIVWFDAFITNPDRTPRNPNMMISQRQPWLIDHGAALYAHHDWPSVDAERARSSFARIRDHVLLARSGDPRAVDDEMRDALTDDVLSEAVSQLPNELLDDQAYRSDFTDASSVRERYLWYLRTRLASPRLFVDEAAAARTERLHVVPTPRSTRR
jgi:hypothetical protein